MSGQRGLGDKNRDLWLELDKRDYQIRSLSLELDRRRIEIAELKEVLTQALDCINNETPEDCTREEAREDTIQRIRDAIR